MYFCITYDTCTLSTSGPTGIDPFVDVKEPNLFEPIHTAIYGRPRNNPIAKDSLWITQRKYIEDRRPPHIAEVLLHDGLNIYEGLISNFFVLIEDRNAFSGYYIQTAPIHAVLAGTMAAEVHKTANDLGIEIRYEFPQVGFQDWIGCFITSTFISHDSNSAQIDAYKWIQPVKSIAVLDE